MLILEGILSVEWNNILKFRVIRGRGSTIFLDE